MRDKPWKSPPVRFPNLFPSRTLWKRVKNIDTMYALAIKRNFKFTKISFPFYIFLVKVLYLNS